MSACRWLRLRGDTRLRGRLSRLSAGLRCDGLRLDLGLGRARRCPPRRLVRDRVALRVRSFLTRWRGSGERQTAQHDSERCRENDHHQPMKVRQRGRRMSRTGLWVAGVGHVSLRVQRSRFDWVQRAVPGQCDSKCLQLRCHARTAQNTRDLHWHFASTADDWPRMCGLEASLGQASSSGKMGERPALLFVALDLVALKEPM